MTHGGQVYKYRILPAFRWLQSHPHAEELAKSPGPQVASYRRQLYRTERPQMAASEPPRVPNEPVVAVDEEVGTSPAGSPNRVAIIVLVVIAIKLTVILTVLAV